MPIFMNPFQKHDVSDFPGVYVPLDQSQRNASVVADHDEKLGTYSNDAAAMKNAETGLTPSQEFSAYTIEGLRAEIDLGRLYNSFPREKICRLIHQTLLLPAMTRLMIVCEVNFFDSPGSERLPKYIERLA